MVLSAGTRLGSYEILAAIGAGGMGEVYRAHDSRLGRDVAIKVLPAALSADADRLRRFEQEARAAAALNHPNILTVHEIGTHDGRPYIVCELLEGQTLRDALGHGALPVKKAIDYALQISQGLAAAHEKRIVHRDLKPENLFVTKESRVKILDFGLAKLTEATVAGVSETMLATRAGDTVPGMVLGTAGYMSPEQVRGHAVDHRSDIFSVGSILYELLSGARAFTGDTAAETMSATGSSRLTSGSAPVPRRLSRASSTAVSKKIRAIGFRRPATCTSRSSWSPRCSPPRRRCRHARTSNRLPCCRLPTGTRIPTASTSAMACRKNSLTP
jgi:serine/threonine protein kinase